MELDALLLARVQFAMTIGFHFLFPPTSIGLAWILCFMEWKGWKTGDAGWLRISQFFGKMLALTFALGVATGIVMEFQFGMNWARYSEFVGDIFGAPLAAEGIFAFFLESSFLGLYLFGRDKVSKGVHWFSSLMVAFGATLSAFWILAANSWQQTPTGFVVANGRAELTSFYEAVFSPSMLPRFCHQTAACLLTGSFLVVGVGAYLVLKNKKDMLARRIFKVGLISSLIFASIVAWVTGDWSAKNVAQNQPAKFAAMEGVNESLERAPILAFAIPYSDRVESEIEVPIPGLLSFLAYGDFNARVKGLNEFPKDERPPVFLPFSAFHTMVGLGTFFFLLSVYGTIQLKRGKIWDQRWLLKIFVFSIPLPLLTNQLGWIVTEVGRQPWIVYGLLRTSEAHSETVSAPEILTSIVLFGTVYIVLCALYIFLMLKKIKAGPEAPAQKSADVKEVA